MPNYIEEIPISRGSHCYILKPNDHVIVEGMGFNEYPEEGIWTGGYDRQLQMLEIKPYCVGSPKYYPIDDVYHYEMIDGEEEARQLQIDGLRELYTLFTDYRNKEGSLWPSELDIELDEEYLTIHIGREQPGKGLTIFEVIPECGHAFKDQREQCYKEKISWQLQSMSSDGGSYYEPPQVTVTEMVSSDDIHVFVHTAVHNIAKFIADMNAEYQMESDNEPEYPMESNN